MPEDLPSRVNVRLSLKEMKALMSNAEQLSTTRSSLLRFLIKKYLIRKNYTYDAT